MIRDLHERKIPGSSFGFDGRRRRSWRGVGEGGGGRTNHDPKQVVGDCKAEATDSRKSLRWRILAWGPNTREIFVMLGVHPLRSRTKVHPYKPLLVKRTC